MPVIDAATANMRARTTLILPTWGRSLLPPPLTLRRGSPKRQRREGGRPQADQGRPYRFNANATSEASPPPPVATTTNCRPPLDRYVIGVPLTRRGSVTCHTSDPVAASTAWSAR